MVEESWGSIMGSLLCIGDLPSDSFVGPAPVNCRCTEKDSVQPDAAAAFAAAAAAARPLAAAAA